MSSSHVQILMGTRNGAAHLAAQLDSFTAQAHGDWSLVVGDDGSRDATPNILGRFAEDRAPGQVRVGPGPGRGSGANFLTLLAGADPAHHVAFSDQDDVWMPHRLDRALAQMAAQGDEPVVYASRTLLTDAALKVRKVSLWPPRGLSFANALVQNVLAGNTLVLSPGAVARFQAGLGDALRAGVPFHDWWVYLLATGAGMRIVLDPEPGLYYRQHAGNLLGASRGMGAALARSRQAMKRDYSGWIDANLAALDACRGQLTPRAAALLDGFVALRAGPAPRRPKALRALGLHRQSGQGDRALALLARTGRL